MAIKGDTASLEHSSNGEPTCVAPRVLLTKEPFSELKFLRA